MTLVSLLATLLIRGIHASLRVRHVRAGNLDRAPQHILAFWHAHLLLMLHCRFRKPISVMISQSKDGEIIARAIEWYGAEASRGSSSRGGGAALRDMIRAARDGKNLAFTPDGPRGPARVVKEGVVLAAQATGLPIVPVVFAAKKKSCCGRGTGWSSRCRSRRRSFSTASRCSCRVTVTSRRGASASSR